MQERDVANGERGVTYGGSGHLLSAVDAGKKVGRDLATGTEQTESRVAAECYL